MADFLDAKVREIEERLQELQPLIEEFHRLEAASAALDGVSVAGAAPARRRRAPSTNGEQRQPAAAAARAAGAAATTRARRRPSSSCALSRESRSRARRHMGIKPNYLYRVLPQLADEGKVRREGKGWHPA